jgi:integrase
MARQEERRARVHGPYPYRNKWRIVVVDEEGQRDHRYFEREEDAKQVVRSLRREFKKAAAKPLQKALEEYELYMRDDLKNELPSVKTTTARLNQFLDGFGGSVEDLDEVECARRYEALRFHVTPRGTRIADDTQLNILAEVKTFLGWCVKMKWAKVNPAVGVEGTGRRRHGKPQLRIDEARKWLALAVGLAYSAESDDQREGAVKAIMTLVLGLREHEVLNRQVRDVDDDGKLLWVPESKTEAGKRTQEVPDFLQPLLLALTKGKEGTVPLFRHRSKGIGRKWVQRICKKAGVMKVNAQSMRGLHATLAMERGNTSHSVAAALGHESFSTTARSYATRESVQGSRQRRTLAALIGNDGQGEGALEHGKLHNFLNNFSDLSRKAAKTGSSK